MKRCHSHSSKNQGCSYLILRKINILEGQKILILTWVTVNHTLTIQQPQKRRKNLSLFLPHPQHLQILQIILMLLNVFSKLSKKSSWEKWRNLRNKKKLFQNLQSVRLLKEQIQTTKLLLNMKESVSLFILNQMSLHLRWSLLPRCLKINHNNKRCNKCLKQWCPLLKVKWANHLLILKLTPIKIKWNLQKWLVVKEFWTRKTLIWSLIANISPLRMRW